MEKLVCFQLYRTEQYGECFDVYRDLVKNTQDEFEEERETNFASVLAALQTWGLEDVVRCLLSLSRARSETVLFQYAISRA